MGRHNGDTGRSGAQYGAQDVREVQSKWRLSKATVPRAACSGTKHACMVERTQRRQIASTNQHPISTATHPCMTHQRTARDACERRLTTGTDDSNLTRIEKPRRSGAQYGAQDVREVQDAFLTGPPLHPAPHIAPLIVPLGFSILVKLDSDLLVVRRRSHASRVRRGMGEYQAWMGTKHGQPSGLHDGFSILVQLESSIPVVRRRRTHRGMLRNARKWSESSPSQEYSRRSGR